MLTFTNKRRREKEKGTKNIDNAEENETNEKEVDDIGLADLTNAELRKIAEKMDIGTNSKMTKSDLINAIEEGEKDD